LRAVGRVDDSALQSALDRLADADFLIAEGGRPHANYRFKHALIQQAAYESLLKSRRQMLHRRVAEVLRDEPERAAAEPEIIAHHFTEAGVDDLAIEWWDKAGVDQPAQRVLRQSGAARIRAVSGGRGHQPLAHQNQEPAEHLRVLPKNSAPLVLPGRVPQKAVPLDRRAAG
jgi:hypothetical protein